MGKKHAIATAARKGRPRAFDTHRALDRALHVFWQKGYEGSSLSDLTRAMGINRPSLYAAFGGKEALFRQVLDRYAEHSDRDLSQVDYYTAFGYWKLACIVEGVYARYIGGAMGSNDPKAFEGFKVQVERCAEQAAAALERLG